MMLQFQAKQRLGAFDLDAHFVSESGVTALFGRSGSGKTSVIRIIAGLSRPDQGLIVFDGDVLIDTERGIFVPKHKRRFATVFQEGRLFPHLSVLQNLNYGRWFTPKQDRADNLTKIVDLLGIGALLDRRPGKLSGGEKQRVAIGRALLSSPRLLLMDEPLAALDDTRKAEILPYLEALRDEMNIPIIYVSHSVAEVARLADRVVLLSEGKVAMAGAATEVLNATSVSIAASKREAGAIVEGKVLNYDAVHRLATIGFKTYRLYVSGAEIAEGRAVRVHILAKDVMVSTTHPENLSALNIIEGTVEGITLDDAGAADIHIECDGTTLLARITRLSCERLGLKQGLPVFAVIKTVALEPY
ncbi:MAG: molybdenum ABC transporter ATP-binding protein [Phyllobacterium sp.]|uniref:molybdenum ABC transporter ATP-binding protein n=1 Tax=Phyllobacterium sp. TaxID=1871046 RepID=UPI0030F070A0